MEVKVQRYKKLRRRRVREEISRAHASCRRTSTGVVPTARLNLFSAHESDRAVRISSFYSILAYVTDTCGEIEWEMGLI